MLTANNTFSYSRAQLFWAATGSIAVIGWIVMLGGLSSLQSATSQASVDVSALTAAALGTSWWNLILCLPLTFGLPVRPSIAIRRVYCLLSSFSFMNHSPLLAHPYAHLETLILHRLTQS